MGNQKPRINIVIVLALAIGIPAVGLGVLYAVQSLWTVSVKAQKAAGILSGLFGEIEPSAQPARSSYDYAVEPVNTTAEEFDAALQTYKDSLLFLDFHFGDSVRTEWDGFLLPNAVYGNIDVQWTQVFDPNNKPIMDRAKQDKERQSSRNTFRPRRNKLHLIDDKVIPARAVGQMTVTVPLTWSHFSFSKDEVGKAKQSGPLSAVLQQCQNDYYRLDVTGDLAGKEIVHFAKDATGQRLGPDSSRKAGNTITAKAKGQVSRVELFVCKERHTAKADVVAHAEPEVSNYPMPKNPPIASPRYVRPGVKWDFVAMTEHQFREQVNILAGRCDAMVGYNDPKIRVCLPTVANSWYASIEFGNKESCKRIPCDDSNQPVPCEVEYGCFGDTEGGIGKEIRFRSPEYPAKDSKQVSFHRAKGEVCLRYPAEIRCVVLTRDNPQSGSIRADFEGCKVVVSGWTWPGDTLPKSDYIPIRAYDQTGCRLRKLGYRFGPFWGKPIRVELVDVTKWIDVTIPYDLPPAPLLPPFGS